ncbi:MAG: hypothetical protein ACI3Z8_06860 [Paludibacteraceae bacterium]
MKKTNFFLVLAIALMALTQSVWAIDPHFYLIGSFTGNNWSGDATKAYPINVNYEAGRSKYCIEVDVVNGNTYYFALFNGDNRYAPLGDENEDNSYKQNKVLDAADLLNYNVRTVCASQGKGTDAWYKKGDNQDKPQDVSENSWQITANYTGKLLICVDEENDQEWYPYVWLERPNNYCLIGDAISGISGDYWNVNNSSCPLVNKNTDGKHYVNLYLKNGSSFALTYGGARFAPSTSPVSVNLNTVYEGSCTNGQDNSWKYDGETGLVRLVFDASAGTFTLEPWQMYLIGNPAQVQEETGKWDVENTSMPLNTPYVNSEGTPEAGKYYCEVLLNRYDYFAFSDGVLRYANNTASENKDIKGGDAGQQGTYDKQNNSWKFVEASYVRVCIDYTSSPKPYIWIEEICPKEIYPIGDACTWGWTIDNAAPLTRKEGEDQVVYSGKLTLQAGKNESGEVIATDLKFLCQQSFDKHYGPAENGVAMDAVGEYDITLLSGTDNKWKNTLEGEYIVTLNVETRKLTVEKPGTTTLVNQTTAINDNIVYDIMGRALGTSVENLPQGIYVRNGKKFVVAQ